MPIRIAISSDLHFDFAGHLTEPDAIRALAARVRDERPDAVVLAGDLAHGLDAFGACVDCFRDAGAPLAVLAGNHDVWKDEATGTGSLALWERALPEATRARGAVWLEHDTLRVGDVAVVGSLAWYDYSAVDPGVVMAPAQIGRVKRLFNNDAHWIDWPHDDRAFARALGEGMLQRLDAACRDPAVRAVLVVTHVPILEAQMIRKPDDPRWGLSNAYFGNMTLGHEVVRQPKVRAVVSGHTHFARHETLAREGAEPIDVRVVGSDYGEPVHLTIEL